MGLLAPLYALAALAVVGPILFHLIRRQPKGQADFSSLMFLKPSPPQLTRRSRVDNWLLLLLRALVLVLLAVAFARPFFRQFMTTAAELASRRVVVAIDTSASMRREAVWAEALSIARSTVGQLGENDQLCLYTIDSTTNAVLPIDTSELTTLESQTSGLEELESLKPTWLAGNLADGVRSIADELVAMSIQGNDAPSISDSIVLISDLHQGCGIEDLQGYEWPERVTLDIRQIDSADSNNASIELLPPLPDKADVLRIRVDNCAESTSSVFTLSFENASGLKSGQTQIQLPPGRTRVVSMGRPPQDAEKVTLVGDGWKADNSQDIIQQRKRTEQILLLTTKQPDDPADRFDYFISKAPLGTADTVRQVTTLETDQTSPSELAALLLQQPIAIFVEPTQIPLEYVAPLEDYLADGGNVLICLASYRGDQGAVEQFIRRLFGDDSIHVSDQQKEDFALIERVDYTHPVFMPFADPRFNDFSKIRIWAYRTVTWDGLTTQPTSAVEDSVVEDSVVEDSFDVSDKQPIRVIAELEGGEPLLAVKTVEGNSTDNPGKVWLLTTGWTPSISSLGLSSKFVPILQGIINRPSKHPRNQTVEVGEEISLADDMRLEYVGTQAGQAIETLATSNRLLLPGRYQVTTPEEKWTMTAIVPRRERNHAPDDGDSVEAFGVKTGEVASVETLLAEAEQLKTEQLERRQRVWQWLIAAGVALLIVESLLTLKSPAQRQTAEQVAT